MRTGGGGPSTLIAGLALAAWNAGAEARAGCAAQPPGLLSLPQRMPTNGVLSLVLSHPVWHSRRAATGAAPKQPLGASVEDLPFVLSRAGVNQTLRIVAARIMPREQVVVDLAPAAGWVPGAAYALRADVGTRLDYPVFSTVSEADVRPPSWGPGVPMAVVVQAPTPEPEAAPPVERCVTTGTGKRRTTQCSFTSTVHSRSTCPPDVTEAHVALRLPALTDDSGGSVMVEVRSDTATTWIPATRKVSLGLAGACERANFPPPAERPYELLITPIDAARNRGATLRVRVEPAPSGRRSLSTASSHRAAAGAYCPPGRAAAAARAPPPAG